MNIEKLIIRGHLIRTARTASFANQNEYKETKKKLRKPEIIGVGISLNWRSNKADNRREKKKYNLCNATPAKIALGICIFFQTKFLK